jgi:hypothetical protein
MASPLFTSYERNMKRQFWMNLIEYQFEEGRRKNFRASIVSNPYSGKPVPVEPVLPSFGSAILSSALIAPVAAN